MTDLLQEMTNNNILQFYTVIGDTLFPFFVFEINLAITRMYNFVNFFFWGGGDVQYNKKEG